MTETLRDWYRGRRIFLTGHTGFKGSWLATWLKHAGAVVTGYALPPDEDRPSLFTLSAVGDGMESILADVRDRDALSNALRSARPEIVLHLAAQSLVRRSYADPVGTFDTNVIGTATLLDALREVPSVRAVVVVTSDKCYENSGLERGYHEGDPMGGHDPYSASKGCQELVTSAFRRSYFTAAGVAVASARAGNVIGGGDWSEDRIVSDLMRAATASQSAAIRNPDAVRPWQHVLEPLRGYLMLARALHAQGNEFAEGWNFGPYLTDAVTVRELVAQMTTAWSQIAADIAPPSDAPHEAHLLRLDNAKAIAKLGWFPVLSLRETVEMTVAWYRAVHDTPASAATVTRQQIVDYEQLVDRCRDADPRLRSA